MSIRFDETITEEIKLFGISTIQRGQQTQPNNAPKTVEQQRTIKYTLPD